MAGVLSTIQCSGENRVYEEDDEDGGSAGSAGSGSGGDASGGKGSAARTGGRFHVTAHHGARMNAPSEEDS